MRVLASGRERGRGLPGAAGGDRRVARLRGRAVAAATRTASCAARETWPAGAAAGAALVADAWAASAGRRGRGAFAFPLAGHRRDGASRPPRRSSPTTTLLATMESLGSQISQFVERCRAQQAVRASRRAQERDPQRRLRLHHHDGPHGNVVEVNRATERTFGYRAEEMIGRELAELIVPPRCARRTGAARALPAHRRTRRSAVTRSRRDGHARRRQRVPGRADRHPRRPARPAAVLRLPARRHRGARRASATCAGWSTSRRRCGAWRPRSRPIDDPRRVFGVVTEEVARLLGAQSSNMVRFDERRTRDRGRRLERGRRRATSRSATRSRWTATPPPARVFRTGAPARIDDYDRPRRRARRAAARARLPLRGRRADLPRRAAVGRGDRLQRRARAVPARAPSSGSPTSPSSPRRRWPTRRRARSSPRRAPASSQAGDAERRRLERNLHDGAQQRLVSLALMLRLAARRHPDDPDARARGRGARRTRWRSCASSRAASIPPC